MPACLSSSVSCDVILDGERYAQSGSPGFQKLSVKERVLSFTVSVAIQHPAAIQDQSKLWSSMYVPMTGRAGCVGSVSITSPHHALKRSQAVVL